MDKIIQDFLELNSDRLDFHLIAKIFGVSIEKIIYIKKMDISFDFNKYGTFELFINGSNNKLYEEYINGEWVKYFYDINGNLIKWLESDGYWCSYQYDNNNNKISEIDSNGISPINLNKYYVS